MASRRYTKRALTSTSASLHACVTVQLNLLDLARSDIDLERAVISNPAVPVLLRNAVMPWGQRNPEPALIVLRALFPVRVKVWTVSPPERSNKAERPSSRVAGTVAG